MGKNGIIVRAQETKIKKDIAEENDAVQLAVTSASITKQSNMDFSRFSTEDIQQELDNSVGIGKTEVTGDDPLIVTFLESGRNYEIQNFYNVPKCSNQTGTNDVGIGENGEEVNLDLWKYELQDDGTYMLNKDVTEIGFGDYSMRIFRNIL